MSLRLIALVGLCALGCSLSLDGAKCPCADGWSCCSGAQVCVRDGQSCPGGADGGACVPGESCPGDVPPIPPAGAIGLSVAEFPDGTIQPGAPLTLTFVVDVAALNRNTTFSLLPSATLLGDSPTPMQTTLFDEDDHEISSIVLPKTDGVAHRSNIRMRIEIPDSPVPTPAQVVLGMKSAWEASTPQVPLRPSSGQVRFTVGAAAPQSNAFSVDFDHPGAGDVTIDPQAGVLHVRISDVVLLYLRADLSQMPAGESYSLEVAADGGWSAGGVVCPQTSVEAVDGASNCPASFTLATPGATQLWLDLQPPFNAAAPANLDVTVRGTDPRHVATVHYGLTVF